jgi:Zn-dependent peptidase ImmA (M78 family)
MALDLSYHEDVAMSEAAKDAESVRASAWGDDFPVDPVRIARRLGIEVLDAQFAPNVSGALVKRPGQDPVILVNAADSPNRKRFTCAHEIGHFVRRSDSPDAYERVDLRGPLASAGQDPEEIYANAFAACLLMPEAEVRRLVKSGKSELELAQYFDVSREAMQYRLQNLRLA